MSDQAFHSVLFPVDFSAASEATAAHVRGVAEQTGASVILLHVIPWLSGWYRATELRPRGQDDASVRKVEEEGAVALELFREQYFSGISCHREVASGAVAETITERAANWGVDLIMMPTRGLGRSRPFLIGSTTAKVLHDACCSVWTSPHLKPISAFHGYRTIVCTMDTENIPRGYIEEATRLASCFNSALIFATAMPNLADGYSTERRIADLASEFPQADVRQAMRSLHCSAITETGAVGDVIKKVAETHSADLVLTNRGRLQHPFVDFRSHAYDIVLESPCPVLSLCITSSQEAEPQSKTGATRRMASV